MNEEEIKKTAQIELPYDEGVLYSMMGPLIADSYVDFFKLEIMNENYSGSSVITNQATGSLKDDMFIKTEPMKITITNAIVKDSLGANFSNFDINAFKVLQERQKVAPLFLSLSKFRGEVVMHNWSVKTVGARTFLSASFEETIGQISEKNNESVASSTSQKQVQDTSNLK